MPNQNIRQMIEENRGWSTALGILLIITGAAAIAAPQIMTLTTEIFVAGVLLGGGVLHIIQAFRTLKGRDFWLQLLIGVLYSATGILFALNPGAGAMSLTIFLAALFTAEGIARLIAGFRLRPQEGWVLMISAGVVAILAGLLIAAKLPSSAVWAIGLLVGVNMMMSGWLFLMLAMSDGSKKETAAA